MAMLAEPRRKTKWSVDPRNSAWSNDETKFGQKMLERMGWSKGKGLGRSEQGSTEHIKVKVKNNTLGLGTTTNNEDNWISHQDDFNQLLADLNNCHGQNNSDETKQEQAQSFSLEEKSKTSKKRVHYMKFTKGKDLSSRTEKDLACVFGKRSKRQPVQNEESGVEMEIDEDTRNCHSNPNVPLQTVTSTMSMQEYFTQRMAQIKKARGGTATAPSEDCDASPPPSSPACVEESMEQSKKKKKKKKSEKENKDVVEEVEDEPSTTETGNGAEDQCKKKKKRKQTHNDEDGGEVSVTPAVDNEEESSSRRKRRKSKKTSQTETDIEHAKIENENMDHGDLIQAKKKKKSKRHEEESVTENKPK